MDLVKEYLEYWKYLLLPLKIFAFVNLRKGICMNKFDFEQASYLSSECGSKLWKHLDPIQTLPF